jgi:GDP-4-dehydro-6-deoxy-D-mannose reductase
MRVLIVGIAGFAGRYLARELEGLGHEVWGTVRSAPLGAARFDRWPTVRCDITDAATIGEALERVEPDGIVLLAGLSFAPEANRDPAAAYRVHALGTAHLLGEVSRCNAKVRVVVVTSGQIYGAAAESRMPLTEESPLHPTSAYATSKAAADAIAAAWSADYGGDIVRVRPFNHTGPGQRPEFVCPDFALQVARVARGLREPVIEVGNIDVVRDFSDIRDIVRGYAAALLRGKSGEAYNLCSGTGTTVRDVLTALCELAQIQPEIRVTVDRQRRAETQVFLGSPRKAEVELGWRPEVPLRQTLADLLEAALEHEGLPDPGV